MPGNELTYKELNERANIVANQLRRLGVKENTLVPLYTGRDIEMLIGILGILKAGAAYVPIDTEFPGERVSYMLEDTKAFVAVSNAGYSEKLQDLSSGYLEVLKLDSMGTEGGIITNPARSLNPSDLAYVIYTSGSTGKPKGVQISHENLVDYVYGLNERTGISACRSYALVSTIATDLGNTALYSSLVFGGTLHVFTRETVSNIEELHDYFNIHRIDCLKIVPSHWRALSPEDGPPLLPERMLIFGGEVLPLESATRIRSFTKHCRVLNHYGPTETTIGKLVYELGPEGYNGQIIPIGRPFSNTKTYILSKELSLCPVGVPGQLYISGQGVASGYLNNDGLTNEKFITNPFDKGGLPMYSTGDKVQYQADGNITFIGRIDDQVKIRGYRVEPGEVGRILEECDFVEQAVVVSRADKQGNNQLVGYIVPKGEYNQTRIIDYLKVQLPVYMIPAHLVQLDRVPLTTNGKIDRKALPDPEGIPTKNGYVAPNNATQQKMAEIWQEVLELDKVGIEDDFFELGGHSLLAVRLISLIRKTFGKELPINDVFTHPTITGIIGQLESENTETSSVLIPIKPTGTKVPLYIVCGSGGTVLKFINFVKMLDDDQPVYGFQQPTDSNDLEGIPNTTEGIAEMYVNAILKQNPLGPYALSGHCYGGKIAIEMANRLKALGKKVSLLAMFDVYVKDVEDIVPPLSSNYYHIPAIANRIFSRISLKIMFEIFLILKHPKQALQYKIDKVRTKLKLLVSQGEEENIVTEFNKVTKVFKTASRNHQMKYYEDEVLVFYAKDKHYFTDSNKGILFKSIAVSDETKYAWKKYAKSVKIYNINGEHSTIFETANAAEFSRILQRHLDESHSIGLEYEVIKDKTA